MKLLMWVLVRYFKNVGQSNIGSISLLPDNTVYAFILAWNLI